MAVCIAVIAKENYPLYIRSVPSQNELKFHYTVHTSLDVVEEKVSAVGKSLADQRELYLGLLYPTEDYKVLRRNNKCVSLTGRNRYGYVTNSKVKFVIVVDSSNTSLRDNEIRSMFRKLHNSFTDVMCNPFYNPGDPIQSNQHLLVLTLLRVVLSTRRCPEILRWWRDEKEAGVTPCDPTVSFPPTVLRSKGGGTGAAVLKTGTGICLGNCSGTWGDGSHGLCLSCDLLCVHPCPWC
ncbi:hypothetical protein CCH79_00005029 [Gambusia affinis]|uniref:Trafficking protein particle complex subunit 2-like protein n=1 Tax=Gambusia affinis TaxID=33528 RepID=A0A315V7N0_GAMAF|nr:hypothetical protein CCH79_00005029 [Gambusia affinis]